MFNEYPEILTVQQVAKALGIGVKAAYSLINEKKIGALRVGKSIKVPKFCLVDYVKTAQLNTRLQ